MKEELKRAPGRPSEEHGQGSGAGPAAATARMTVAGRVLDVVGKPMAGVPVDVIGRSCKPLTANEEKADRFLLLGKGTSDADGRLLIGACAARRSASSRFMPWRRLPASDSVGRSSMRMPRNPTADIRLQTERIVRGKLTDISGLPAAGVELCVVVVRHPSKIGLLDGMNMATSQVPEGVRVWPRPVITDDNGQFTLTGIGPDLAFSLAVRDRRFAQQILHIGDANTDGSQKIVMALQPATVR